MSTAKKSKTTTFSRVFQPKEIDNFLGKSKLNFWTKNEDFEQCDDDDFRLSIELDFLPFSAKTRANLSRTRQQVVFRIHEIRTKMDPPPTYEESLEEQKSNNDDESIIPSVPSDAQILFTIAGLVQIFYIKIDGSVSAPSYPSSLFIFRFCDSKEDSAFLQVGTWVYPLIKGKSPILKSNEGAYMFPDLDESIEGNAIGNVQLYFVL